jgi:hypothetical protein
MADPYLCAEMASTELLGLSRVPDVTSIFPLNKKIRVAKRCAFLKGGISLIALITLMAYDWCRITPRNCDSTRNQPVAKDLS